ncbi:hypothetical protein DWX43_14835 [Clostridium sp. AF19-22AC]|jgi:hypothetical protein|uniref:relaxase/mobilization nuclease domain-containing protein n=1 Tax=Clostridia TaxID=186801 RepID=UPI000E49004E|nr:MULTISPECIES: relaxase/mobilization nuclease domain-containing protein [Clostridia]RHR27107.1 hypothetical protein DWX43_14835 [Clostridium sp. AF19-22AC]
MAVFKIVNESYCSLDDIYRELTYIYNHKKCVYHGTSNLLDGDITVLQNQFLYVKNYYRKTKGKQLENFILSLDSAVEEKHIDLRTLNAAARYIIEFCLEEYQVAYAIHNNRSNFHVHFIMNTVNIRTGKHFRLNKSNFHEFMGNIAMWLELHGIALQNYSYYDEKGKFRCGKNDDIGLYLHKMPNYI